MWGNLAHNFAGEGNQVHFHNSDRKKGHVTTYLTQEGARSTDCWAGSKTCPHGGNWASHHFDAHSIDSIKRHHQTHHFDIDIWDTNQAMSLKVSNLKLKGGSKFIDTCHVAHPTSF